MQQPWPSSGGCGTAWKKPGLEAPRTLHAGGVPSGQASIAPADPYGAPPSATRKPQYQSLPWGRFQQRQVQRTKGTWLRNDPPRCSRNTPSPAARSYRPSSASYG